MNQGKNIAQKWAEITNLPIIDWHLCVKLANNKTEIAQEILSLVIEQLPDDLRAITQAYQRTDYRELLRSIHKLHGALCYCAMPRLKDVVGKIENLLKQSEWDKVMLNELYSLLKTETAHVLQSFHQLTPSLVDVVSSRPANRRKKPTSTEHFS